MGNTFTNSNENKVLEEVPLLETSGNVKSTIRQRDLILVGTWACTLLLTSSASSVSGYNNVSTSLYYPNKMTQATVEYSPKILVENNLIEEINSSIFVRTRPEKSYRVKLKIKSINTGKPVIDDEDYYEA